MTLLLNNSDVNRSYPPFQTVRHFIHTATKAYLRRSVKFYNERYCWLELFVQLCHTPEIVLRKIVDRREAMPT